MLPHQKQTGELHWSGQDSREYAFTPASSECQAEAPGENKKHGEKDKLYEFSGS